MAVEITKKRTFNIGNFIVSQINTFTKNRERIRSVADAEFQRRVIDNGLSNKDQKTYYENLLQQEEAKSVPDKSYISNIKDKLTIYNKLIEAETFANEYRGSFERLRTQQDSIDDHLAFLESRLDVVKDDTLKTQIEEKISQARQDKYTIQNNVLMNKITFAQNDKRPEVLQDVITQVQDKYNQALASGNTESATNWELQLQSLNSQMRKVTIEKKVNEFEISGMNGKFDAVSTLEFLTNMYNESDGKTPITIDGVSYANEKEYWNGKTNDYLQNNFFTILQDEMTNDIDVNAKKLTPILEKNFDNSIVKLDGLKSNEFLKPYLDKLDNVTTNVSAYGVDKIGTKVVNDYKNGLLGKTSSENISNAIEKLTNLNKWYNVDVKTSLDTIINDVASKKSTVVSNQLQSYYDSINKGMSPLEAWKIAESSTAQIDIPDSELVNTKPIDVAKETVSSLDNKSKYDIANVSTPVTPEKVSTPEFKPISTPKVETPVIEKGEYIPNPELLSLLKPEQIVTEGGKKYLAKGVTAPYKKVSNVAELQKYKPEQIINIKDSVDKYIKL